MPRKNLIKKVKRIVVKVGTSSVSDNGSISSKKLSKIASEVAELIGMGYEIVIVTSGAITAGAGALNKDRAQLTLPEKQAMAAVGQTILMDEYRKHFIKKGYHVGQILITDDDLKSRTRFLNARNAFMTLLKMGVIPIVNENDTVGVNEIKFGDNDTLSAHVASIVDADLLIILSDVDGFFRDLSDPEPVEEINSVTEELFKLAGGAGSSHGTGGMITKLRAADIIIRFGEMMIIANGAVRNVLVRIMHGERIGTIFAGKEKPMSSRKKWLALRNVKGRILLDNGAVEAVVHRNKSLLATGVLDVEGAFHMGDFVELADQAGNPVGKGMVNYSHAELADIKGLKSDQIKKIYGTGFFEEVVHRDNLITY